MCHEWLYTQRTHGKTNKKGICQHKETMNVNRNNIKEFFFVNMQAS